MLDFPLKTGFYPVFRFHSKSGSHPYLRVVTDVVVMGEGPPLLLLLLLLLLMLLLMLQLLLVPLGPRRVPLAAAATAPLVPVVGVDIPRVPRILMWRPITI